ncbi:MAG: nucleoside-diphosphate kinase, partial [Dehalococcoidales bacterium]|nr:nucleoside-diphosphate kinase [Dehalococcoidales bacterium]
PMAEPEAIAMIEEARSAVLVGAGSPFTSAGPQLLPRGIAQALITAKNKGIATVYAPKVSWDLETDELSLVEQIEALERSVQESNGDPSIRFEHMFTHIIIPKVPNSKIAKNFDTKKIHAKYRKRLTPEGQDKLDQIMAQATKDTIATIVALNQIMKNEAYWTEATIRKLKTERAEKLSKVLKYPVMPITDADRQALASRGLILYEDMNKKDDFMSPSGKIYYKTTALAQHTQRIAQGYKAQRDASQASQTQTSGIKRGALINPPELDSIAFVMIKPDGVMHTEAIIKDFEQRGLEVLSVVIRESGLSEEVASRLYAEHDKQGSRLMFRALIQYVGSGKVTLLILRSSTSPAYEKVREALGKWDGKAKGTMRNTYGVTYKKFTVYSAAKGSAEKKLSCNKIHGSDSIFAVRRELYITHTQEELQTVFTPDSIALLLEAVSQPVITTEAPASDTEDSSSGTFILSFLLTGTELFIATVILLIAAYYITRQPKSKRDASRASITQTSGVKHNIQTSNPDYRVLCEGPIGQVKTFLQQERHMAESINLGTAYGQALKNMNTKFPHLRTSIKTPIIRLVEGSSRLVFSEGATVIVVEKMVLGSLSFLELELEEEFVNIATVKYLWELPAEQRPLGLGIIEVITDIQKAKRFHEMSPAEQGTIFKILLLDGVDTYGFKDVLIRSYTDCQKFEAFLSSLKGSIGFFTLINLKQLQSQQAPLASLVYEYNLKSTLAKDEAVSHALRQSHDSALTSPQLAFMRKMYEAAGKTEADLTESLWQEATITGRTFAQVVLGCFDDAIPQPVDLGLRSRMPMGLKAEGAKQHGFATEYVYLGGGGYNGGRMGQAFVRALKDLTPAERARLA